jgi:hypothetical protein
MGKTKNHESQTLTTQSDALVDDNRNLQTVGERRRCDLTFFCGLTMEKPK